MLYGFYLLADWKISGSSLSNKEYSFPLLFASFAFIFALNSNSLFVKNYNSGTFIFGIMNTIMYGGDASSDDINEIYRPLIDEDIFIPKNRLVQNYDGKKLLVKITDWSNDNNNPVILRHLFIIYGYIII